MAMKIINIAPYMLNKIACFSTCKWKSEFGIKLHVIHEPFS